MIEEGNRFPHFSMKDQDGKSVNNETLKNTWSVFYFYPKDDTPGCTTEACEFRDSAEIKKLATVYGVSPDDEASHKKFIKKHSLNFSLLIDEEHKLCEDLGIWVEKSMYGKKYMGIERTTVLVDNEGIVRHVWRKVKPEGHAAEVLVVLKSLR